MRTRYCAWLLAGLSGIFGCSPSRLRQIPTVPGPEVSNILPHLKGYILLDRSRGGIAVISLPTCKERLVRPTGDDGPVVQTLSGPDSEGRIAYIDNHLFASNKQHQLKVSNLDGNNEQTLFTRSGDALWDNVMSRHFALSPMGGKIVFASHLQGAQMVHPQALLQEGQMELWEIDRRAGHMLSIQALDGGFSWFPDGKRLAYVALVPRSELGELLSDTEPFGIKWARWERVPTVRILDTVTGNTTFLHVGWEPVVASNGKTVLVSDGEYHSRLVWPADGHSQPAYLPGQWSGALALLDNGTALYMGLPTAGTTAKMTESNSPLVGPKPMLTIKAADVNTGKFQTIIPYIDPRQEVSFGAISE